MAWSDILEEHADEAAFLFRIRGLAFVSYRQSLHSLAGLEERLLAHLDGLRVAPELAWELCGDGLGSDQPGEAFVAGWLALHDDSHAQAAALEGALEEPASIEGLSGALRLTRAPGVEARLERLAAKESLPTRALALDALAFRGRPVEPARTRALLESDDSVARMAGVNVAARCRQREFRTLLVDACGSSDEWLVIRALQALAAIGDSNAAGLARVASKRADRAGGAAIRLLGAIGGAQEAATLTALVAGPHGRVALLALGRLGDPTGVETLIAACDDPKLARAAGHGFEVLTGARLEADRLSRPGAPPDTEALELDPDDGLPWPDPERVRGWWARREEKPRRAERWRGGMAFEWEAVAREAADEFLPLPDRDEVMMELSARLALDHAERRDWSDRLRAATPAPAAVRRRAREISAGPWP
jgi:uncharacterized protein (TIGR02270 family)